MYPHRIRLAGPWECEVLASRGASAPECTWGLTPPASPKRVTIPCHWHNFTGTARFTRRFGYPGRIDEYERVWLTFAAVSGRAHVSLNTSELGTITDAAEFEVARMLQERNKLQVDIEGSGSDAGLPGEVALEVRRTAFLRNLRVSINDELQVSGGVAGSADGPLEIHVVFDRKNVAYAVVEAGKEFHLTGSTVGLEDSTHPTHVVRIDLVQGASIWYRAEVQLTRNP
jgi:hypothetical protein